MIFGAGIFALPFSVVRAGIFWGTFHFILALVLMVFLHFWYGEIAYNTLGKHRFTGYVEMILGKKAKWTAFFVTIFSYYGALLVYGLLGGIFLSNLLPFSSFVLSLLVFAFGSALLFLRSRKIAGINFYLSIALLGLVFYLFIIAFPFIRGENFSLSNFSTNLSGNWFLPYGIWLFALAGFAVIPEVRDMLLNFPIKNLKRVILISLLTCAIFYLIFVLTVVGVTGEKTTEEALAGLIAALGTPALLAGSLIGFLGIFTSFIALGIDLRGIFYYDFHFSSLLSWFAVALPPVILFILGATDFVRILSILGSVGLGLMGILIILMTRRLKKNLGQDGKFLHFSWAVFGLIVAGIIAAIIS